MKTYMKMHNKLQDWFALPNIRSMKQAGAEFRARSSTTLSPVEDENSNTRKRTEKKTNMIIVLKIIILLFKFTNNKNIPNKIGVITNKNVL